MFGYESSTKLVSKWLRLKHQEIQPVFCAINQKRCDYRTICDRILNGIIKPSVVKVKRRARPSDLKVLGHSLRVCAAQDLLIKGFWLQLFAPKTIQILAQSLGTSNFHIIIYGSKNDRYIKSIHVACC